MCSVDQKGLRVLACCVLLVVMCVGSYYNWVTQTASSTQSTNYSVRSKEAGRGK